MFRRWRGRLRRRLADSIIRFMRPVVKWSRKAVSVPDVATMLDREVDRIRDRLDYFVKMQALTRKFLDRTATLGDMVELEEMAEELYRQHMWVVDK